MRFSLEEQTCKIANVNPRAEKHGDQKKPAADVKFSVKLPNAELKQFSKDLLEIFYQKATKGQQDMHSLVELRFPMLKVPVGWEDQVVGADVTIHRGISSKSNISIKGCILGGFAIEPEQGGTIEVGFTMKFYPENEDQIGKISMLTGQEVNVSVVSPTQREQEKMQRDMLEDADEEATANGKAKEKEPA